MTLRSQIAAVVGQAFSPDFLGEEVEYNGVPIDAIFTPLVDPQNTRAGSSATATLQVQVSEVAAWAVDDVVSVGGVTWRVKREAPGSTFYKHVLHIERDRRMKP